MKTILFSDIDGTLMRGGKLSPEDTDAVKQFRARGHSFILCTGRMPPSVEHFLDLFPNIECDGAVLAGGGGLYRTESRSPACVTPLERVMLDRETSLELLEYIYSTEPRFSIHWSDGPGRFGLEDRHVFRSSSPDPQFVLIDEWKAMKMSMLVIVFANLDQDPKETLRVRDAVLSRWGAHLEAHTNGFYLDVSAKGADKGHGIRRMASLLGGGSCPHYGVGDGFNDTPMFQAVGKDHAFLIASGEQSLLPLVRQSVPSVAACIEEILKIENSR